ncbi:MAG: AraC family transcriptional regulator, partial [Pseudomonadales bacterium]
MEHSTIGPIGTVIAQALEASGVDVASLFAEVGLDVASLRDPNVRIPTETMLQLIRKADAASNDPAFGLSLSQYVHPTTFYSLGIAMYSSDTLRDFLARYVKYYRLITTNDSLQAEESDGLYRMTATPISELDTVPTRVDGFAALTTKIIRNATDEHFAPAHVALARPNPDGLEQRYLDYFLCPVEFDAPLTVLTLRSEQLDLALPTANPELTRMYEEITQDYLAKIDKADFPRRVQ